MGTCMWWGASSPGDFGIPFGMFLFFFVDAGHVVVQLRNGDADVTNREQLEEVRRLRQEVEALKNTKNQ